MLPLLCLKMIFVLILVNKKKVEKGDSSLNYFLKEKGDTLKKKKGTTQLIIHLLINYKLLKLTDF